MGYKRVTSLDALGLCVEVPTETETDSVSRFIG